MFQMVSQMVRLSLEKKNFILREVPNLLEKPIEIRTQIV